MSQEVILKQFQQYLEVTWVEYIAGLNEQHRGLTDEVEKEKIKERVREQAMQVKGMHADMDEGLCFGLSVCHAVMDLLGKESWWEDALQHIYHWDGKPETLDRSINLRDAKDKKSTTLRHIFELAMSYIVHAHDSDGKVKTIQQNKRAVGHFTKDQLSALLQEEDLRNGIILIHSCWRTIQISAKGNGVWQLYDANLPHESTESMHQLGSKSEIIINYLAAITQKHPSGRN